ncbi:hypothetical protein ACFVXR_10145 [Bacillus thuringiensis]|uniref:Uncharacterized protein n=3 Tax=Bacillus cereus group TaxID=86661 RepID=A0A9X6YR04_BACCE|nr:MULTISPECIES: hypothetical protein [Bacillus]EOO36578.1 hypothetical protein IIU_01594 [Bacillus cereus VD133]KAB2376012.1 hypothetical protein F8510_13170 [Bacillus sp. RM2(2019)]MBE5089453.1 hypothetical protein [Bacillus thuringiensis]MBK5496984.1 hypothetical protein [Bacillus sp. TH13]MCC2496862.1 hypothetical protein [Bacillus cereus]
MLKIKEEDLGFFQITNKNRLSPDGVMAFLVGVFVYASLPMFFIILGFLQLGWETYPKSFERIIVSVELALYILQILFLIIYSFPKLRFKLQKLQAVVIVFNSFQVATVGYAYVLIEAIFGYYCENLTVFYVGLLLLGAIITHIVITIHTFKKAKYGGYKLKGESASFFTNTKLWMLIGMFIYIVVLLILIFASIRFALKPMVFYFLQTIILYVFAVASAEFVLLVYCRFKFPSFNITWEQHEKERQEFIANRKRMREKEQKQNKN